MYVYKYTHINKYIMCVCIWNARVQSRSNNNIRRQPRTEVAQVWSTRYFLTAMSSRPWLPLPPHQFQTWLFELNNGLDGGHTLMSISVFSSVNNFVLTVSESLNDSASKLIACQMRRDNE